MAEAAFRYLFYDLMSGTSLGELPLQQVSFGSKLNDAGTFSGQLDFTDPRVQALGLGAPDSLDARTAIYVDLNGTLVWDGILWDTDQGDDSNLGMVSFAGTEGWSYFKARRLAKDYSTPWSGAPVDPMVIARTLVNDAIAVGNSAYGDLTVVLSGSTALGNYLPSAAYPYNQPQYVATVVEQLAKMAPGFGFDFVMKSVYDATKTPQPFLTLSYPRAGRVAGTTGLVYDITDASQVAWPSKGSQMANDILETAGGAGGYSAQGTNTDSLAEGYPLLQTIISQVNINYQSQLVNLLEGDLVRLGGPVRTPSITVPLSQSYLGTFTLGDDVEVRIPATAADGLSVFDPRFPNGIDAYFRIVGYNVTVANDGVSTVQLVLNDPPVLI